jgi:hypothetical protein
MKLDHRRRSVTTDEEFFQYIESCPKGEKVFMLTDNPKTQEFYLHKYSDKILVYKDLKSIPTLSKNNVHSSSPGNGEDRYTSLAYAFTEVLIAAHAYNFQGTVGSSCSDMISTFADLFASQKKCKELAVTYTAAGLRS